MAIFRREHKSNEELRAELARVTEKRRTTKERRELKRAIREQKIGRAKDILKEIYHNAKAIGRSAYGTSNALYRQARRAYSTSNRRRAARMWNYLNE
jgi:cell division septum initiation protein DivIVA